MKHHEHRGVSLGTIVMLTVTLIVLVGSGAILPRLMGHANISVEEIVMRSSVNMNDSLPAPALVEIPIVNVTGVPAVTEAPATAAPEHTPAPSQSETTASPAPAAVGKINLTFGGSIVVDDLIRKSGYYSDTKKYDFTENLSLIADELDSDLTLVTLETLTNPDENVKQIPNAPDTIMDMLSSANIDMVALGYNRSGEMGLQGISSTIEQAEGRGLKTLGVYVSQEDADNLRIVTIDQVNVAYLHYTDVISSTSRRKLNNDSAAYALPTAEIDSDATEIADDIRRAREAGAQIVIVSLNWSGTTSFNITSTKMKGFVQSLANAGADVIVGAGTKAVQELTWIMGKRADGTTRQTLCAWSLGSLLNGNRKDGNVTGMLLHLQLSYNGSAVSFERVAYTPTYIWRYKQDDQYRYRVVASDLAAPDGMDSTQQANALRSFENLKKSLGDSPVTLRTK